MLDFMAQIFATEADAQAYAQVLRERYGTYMFHINVTQRNYFGRIYYEVWSFPKGLFENENFNPNALHIKN